MATNFTFPITLVYAGLTSITSRRLLPNHGRLDVGYPAASSGGR